MMTQSLQTTEDPVKLCGILKAIGHPERLAIFRYLTEKGSEATVKEIYNALGLEQPVASRQLGILKNHGIVKRASVNGNVTYFVNKDSNTVNCIQDCLFHL